MNKIPSDILKDIKNNLSPEAVKNIQIWLENDQYAEFHAEINQQLDQQNWAELEDAFHQIINFGTAGRRGKVGAGPNRLNTITIGESAQALADYLRQSSVIEDRLSVVIAYDVRNSSLQFAQVAASVLAENDIKVHLFDSPRSTPELSFAVRYLQASAGIVVSASHNPPQDNGIKMYWFDGAQISSPHDKNLIETVERGVEIKSGDFQALMNQGLISMLDDGVVDDKYIEANIKLSLSDARAIKIVYSPIHGTGTTNLLKTLRRAGFEDIELIEEQLAFDGDFTTVPDHKPNPELPSANLLAIDKMEQSGADIAFTTDPDADRIAVISKEKSGEIRLFSGNETAVLAAEYVLRKMQAANRLTSNHFVAKTAVTTDALKALAKKFNVKIYDNFLAGFKYVGRVIEAKQTEGEQFIAGFEESLGGLIGDQARDKDSATVGLMIAELAAELKMEGKTLSDHLTEIYQEIGFYSEKTIMIDFDGPGGFQRMNKVMDRARSGGIDVRQSAMIDYLEQVRTEVATGDQTLIDLIEPSNTLAFEFGDPQKKIVVRPSGTEPKLKIYFMWYGGDREIPSSKREEILKDFTERII